MTARSLLLLLALAATPLAAQPIPSLASPSTDSTLLRAVQTAALALEAEIEAGHPEALAEWFDSDAFLDRANEDRQIGALVMSELRVSFQNGNDLLATILDQLRQGGQFRFLRVVERDGDLRARFRMLDPNSGIIYHDLLLLPDSSGTARFVDTYVFSTAEDLSDTVGRLMEMMATEGFLSPRTKAYTDFFDHFNAGRYREAWNAYPVEHIDADNRKALMLVRIQIGLRVGDREYHEALDAFADAFPDDPSLPLILLDVHFNNGAFEAMLETVDRLERSVGGDPYLGIFGAMAHLGADAPEAALEEARRALKAEPTLLVPNVIEFRALVALQRFDEAAEALRRMTTLGYDLSPSVLEGDPVNEAFVLSKPYLTWRDELAP